MSVFIENLSNGLFQSLEIEIGITIGPFTIINQLDSENPVLVGSYCSFKRCYLGRFFGCGNACSATDVRFGSFVSIGDRVVFNAGKHPKHSLTTHLFPYNKTNWGNWNTLPSEQFMWRVPQEIGCDVWVGTNVVVLTGVSIGHGAIIGANSFVNSDVPPYAICVGTPARIIGYRFGSDVIQRLLLTKWWDLPIEKIAGLPFSDVEKCLTILEANSDVGTKDLL